jgi:hypothetical protein
MRADAIQAIDDLKPYKEGNLALWKLRELDNIDKHRVILSVGEDCLLEGPWVGWTPYLMKASQPHFEAAELPEIDLRASAFLGDPAIIKRNSLYPTLRELLYYVEYIIESFHPCLEAEPVLGAKGRGGELKTNLGRDCQRHSIRGRTRHWPSGDFLRRPVAPISLLPRIET